MLVKHIRTTKCLAYEMEVNSTTSLTSNFTRLTGKQFIDQFPCNLSEYNITIVYALSNTRTVLSHFGGIGLEDKVAMIANNRIEWASTYYATVSLGAQLVPM